MSRYRPPPQASSAYITPEGHARLDAELKYLWKVKRPEVTQALSAAAAEGDRSENAEYIYRKKQLREIDRRVRYLSKRLDELVVVDRTPEQTDRVFFGAWVELEDEQGRLVRYRLVGPDEFDPALGYISMDSPMGRALMKKTEGDEVRASLPKGEALFTLLAVQYRPFDAGDKP